MHETLTYSSIIFSPREEVWAFYSDPNNLNSISPAFARLSVERADVPLRPGSQVVINKLWLLKIRWHLQVVELTANHHFIDQQISGPFRFWRHTHTFEPSDVGTRLTDRVEFALPPLLHWLAAPFVHLLLKIYFVHRHRLTRHYLEGRGIRRKLHRYTTIRMNRASPQS
jgi:hypothetical protein